MRNEIQNRKLTHFPLLLPYRKEITVIPQSKLCGIIFAAKAFTFFTPLDKYANIIYNSFGN
jgi:hypothetical protein